ncbi:PREDICTED: alpha-tocopherol transfer protein-like isoform X1 [Wasmannia auropunctata]|uniref:alpha-tocopherol transfer protein-like isoform X1 n=1 Tax=Wasmannia auropunctata TaxID=64793 RepID=UPI0005F0B4EF|nr:PREDICTED: alpha-tocopherol transfer protein-like isoform X1 [Wasmannia auropunctata]
MMANERNYNDSVVHVLQELTSEDKKYAAAHLNETDETRKNAVAEIRRWCEDELRVRIDDFLILRFLRVCAFNLKDTKTRMRNYYKQRFNFPDWYMNKDPFRPELQELLDSGLFLPLRKVDSRGRLVIISHATRYDPTRHKPSDFYKIGLMLAELAIKNNPTASVYGYVLFIDVDNLTIRHVTQFRPYILDIIHAWQNCVPIRWQSINILNAPIIFDITIRIMKSFMTIEMKNRFHVYRHMLQSCFEDVPADILPFEYGGTGSTIRELTDYWKKLIEENRDWIMSDENGKIE